jgi:hypothetical protein
MKSFAKKLAFGLITTLALLGSVHALAQSGPGGLGPLIDNLPKPGDNPFSGLPSGVTCSGSSCSAPARDPEQVLAKEREEDRKKCEAEVGGLGGLANQAGGIQDIVNKGLSEQLPTTLEQVFSERIPAILQEKLPEFIPQALQRGLQDQLPGYVNSAIGDLFRAGMSQGEIGEVLPGIINQGVGQLAPRIIERELPAFLESTLTRELPGQLGNQFRGQIPGIISQSSLPGEMSQLVGELISAAGEAGQSATDETHSIWSGVLDLGDPNLDVSDEERQIIEAGLMEGIINETNNSLTQSSGLNQMAETIAPQIAQLISQQIAPHLLQVFSGGFAEAGNSFGSAFDSSINGLFGQDFDLSGGLTGEVLNPIMKELDKPLTDWAVQGIKDFKLTPDQISDQYFNNLAGEVDGALKKTSGDVANGVAAKAPEIGRASVFSQQGLANLGNGMKGALAGSLGGIVGGFAGQIPIVGGLVGNLAENMITGVMNEILGVSGPLAGVANVPTDDNEAQSNIRSGFQEANKIAGETESNTKTSNENEKQLQKTMDEIKKVEIDACTRAKTSARINQRMEEKEFVTDPNARKASFFGLKGAVTAIQEGIRNAYKTSPGVTGVQNTTPNTQRGETLVADYEADIEAAEKEGEARALNQVAQSGNPDAQTVLRTISSFKDDSPIASTMTEGERAALNAPLDPNDTDATWAARAKFFEPNNNPRGLLLRSIEQSNREKLAANLAAQNRYIANQGFRDIRECELWVPDPFSPEADPLLGGYCAKWMTLTPGSHTKDNQSSASAAYLNFIASGDEHGEDFANQVIPTLLEESQNLAQGVHSQNGASPTGGDPCSPDEPCPQTGWNPNQIEANVASRLSDYNINQSRAQQENSNLPDLPNFELPDLSSLFPPLEIEYFRVDNGPTLRWAATNAITCQTQNDWLGTDYKAGDDLTSLGGSIGFIALNLPTNYPELEYRLTCIGNFFQGQQTTAITLPAGNISS